eukprot:Opistho-2@445
MGRAWMQVLADRLRTEFDIGAYILDPRGVGLSGGKRGDAKSPEHLWSDVRTMVRFVRTRYPGIPLVLVAWGRHGGLLLNYVSWKESTHVDGLAFLATGFSASIDTLKMETLSRMGAKLNTFDMAMSKLSGGLFRSHGATYRLSKAYTEQIKATLDPLFVSHGSAMYILAHQVDHAVDVIRGLDIPFCYVVGENDEFVIGSKVREILESNEQVHATRRKIRILPRVRHLELLV